MFDSMTEIESVSISFLFCFLIISLCSMFWQRFSYCLLYYQLVSYLGPFYYILVQQLHILILYNIFSLVAIFSQQSVLNFVMVQSLSQTVACRAPLSMRFFRQEYWSRLPFPSAGDLPDPGIKPRFSALQADSLLTKLNLWICYLLKSH